MPTQARGARIHRVARKPSRFQLTSEQVEFLNREIIPSRLDAQGYLVRFRSKFGDSLVPGYADVVMAYVKEARAKNRERNLGVSWVRDHKKGVAGVGVCITSSLGTNEQDTCRWPFGHPGEKGFRFCGQEVVRRGIYCVEHEVVSKAPKYVPTKKPLSPVQGEARLVQTRRGRWSDRE